MSCCLRAKRIWISMTTWFCTRVPRILRLSPLSTVARPHSKGVSSICASDEIQALSTILPTSRRASCCTWANVLSVSRSPTKARTRSRLRSSGKISKALPLNVPLKGWRMQYIVVLVLPRKSVTSSTVRKRTSGTESSTSSSSISPSAAADWPILILNNSHRASFCRLESMCMSFTQGFEEFGALAVSEGLADKGQATLADSALHRRLQVGGHDDDPGARALLENRRGGLEAGDTGHIEVHRDQIDRLGQAQRDGLHARSRLDNHPVGTQLDQDAPGHHARNQTVINDQKMLWHGILSGMHAIAPGSFSLIERLVGGIKQVFKAVGFVGKAGEANGNGEVETDPVKGPRRLGDGVTQTLGGVHGLQQVRVRQDHGKFFPAQTADDVDIAQCAAQNVTDPAEGFITHGVAMVVIDPLEVIDVHHQHGVGVLVAFAAFQGQPAALIKGPSIVETGHGVGARLEFQCREQFLVF